MSIKHLLVLALVLGLVGLWLARAPGESPATFPMPAGRTYVSECGACHAAFAPGLLPARSWRKMMAELANHFGEDASLDEPQYFAILKELETLAADGSYADMRMRRIRAAIAPGEAPQRITRTAYFAGVHEAIPREVWQRKAVGSPVNCAACHVNANQGRFSEQELRVPGI